MPTLDFQLSNPQRCFSSITSTQDTMEHKITEALSKGSLYEAAAKSIAPEIFGHQDVTWAKKDGCKVGPLLVIINGFTTAMHGLING